MNVAYICLSEGSMCMSDNQPTQSLVGKILQMCVIN
jgi:hypothetical protein